MKYLVYILRNIRRNPVRSLLTAASIAICTLLMVSLAAFFSITKEVAGTLRTENRLVTMSSQGFAGKVPIKLATEIAAVKGIEAASPFSWFGGKFRNQQALFAQFGVNPDTVFNIYGELTIPPDQLEKFKVQRNSCVIGKLLAQDYKLRIGDRMPLEGDLYPVSLDLEIVGIYDGPSNRDRRMVMFNWDYLNEQLKNGGYSQAMDNAGTVFSKAASATAMPTIIKAIDDNYRSSDTPTKTQSEEAFVNMFSEYLGNLKDLLLAVGASVVLALLLVSGNAMAMSLRERTTEIAVLKAIGFSKPLVLAMVLAESILVAGIGGLVGAIGTKLLFDVVDVSKFSGGFLTFFYISWPIALTALVASLFIGFFSGILPALAASRLSVISGLRKVV